MLYRQREYRKEGWRGKGVGNVVVFLGLCKGKFAVFRFGWERPWRFIACVDSSEALVCQELG